MGTLHTQGRLNDGTTIDYAFGLEIGLYRGLRTVSHGGSWAGYRSELLRFPERNLSVICLCNLASMMPEALARRVADIYLEKDFKAPAAKAQEGQSETEKQAFAPDSLDPYVGKYHNSELDADYILTIRENQLYLQRNLYMPPEGLLPIAPEVFKAEELQLQFSGSDLLVSQERVKNMRFTMITIDNVKDS